MVDRPTIRVRSAASAATAIDLLGATGAGARNPAGELVAVDGFADEVADDPQRWSLVPAALAAIERAHEIWSLPGEGEESGIEHRPHLLWCSVDDAPAELLIAGTRRADGHQLRLHTWFRYADPEGALHRYWQTGTAIHPVRQFAVTYAQQRDVLYLRPEPHLSYRVLRVATRPPVYAYLSADLGFPSLVGLEVQDARRHAGDIVSALPAGLVRMPCRVAGLGSGTMGSLIDDVLRERPS